jgi:hypothetical protein
MIRGTGGARFLSETTDGSDGVGEQFVHSTMHDPVGAVASVTRLTEHGSDSSIEVIDVQQHTSDKQHEVSVAIRAWAV